MDILREVGIRPRSQVLDCSCGPGGYTSSLGELVSRTGQIYALDINPAALEATRLTAVRPKLRSVRLILSDCSTGLSDDSVGLVLLYVTFLSLARPGDVLIMTSLTGSGMFMLAKKGERTHSFVKASTPAS